MYGEVNGIWRKVTRTEVLNEEVYFASLWAKWTAEESITNNFRRLHGKRPIRYVTLEKIYKKEGRV